MFTVWAAGAFCSLWTQIIGCACISLSDQEGTRKAQQYFTGHGILGVILFVVGNIASAGFLVSWFGTAPYQQIGTGSLIAGGICGFATLISIPLMLIGREYQIDLPKRDG
jgi:hypothetical protein